MRVAALALGASSRSVRGTGFGPPASPGAPGTALDDSLRVACGTGALRLLRVQAPGRAAMPADAFLRGRPVPAGTILG